MANNSPGGSGRGNKGTAVIDDPDRPQCPDCGGFMASDGRKKPLWKCTDCGKKLAKKGAFRRSVDDFTKQWGFDIEAAEKYAQSCQKYKRIIVTSAQNNTPLFHPFWKSLNQAAAHFNCPIAVIPVHYKNVSAWNRDDKKEWPPEVQPYLVKGDIEFNNVTIKSDIKIAATAINPLAGLQAMGGNHWTVFGHAQCGMEPVATPADIMPKRLYTTGSVSMENYSISKEGEKARFHHTMGALLIEKHKDICFVRRLNCDDNGHFYDLDVKFTQTTATKGHRLLSLTTGDEHVKFNTVEKETYTGRGSIVKTLRPQYIVRHDVLDGYAGSHHHEKDPLLQFKKHHNGDNDYRAELEQAIDFINRTTPKDAKTLIVPSNHHDHLYKWLATADANKDHTNAILICELQKAMREAVLSGENPDPFYLYAKDKLTCDFEFLDRSKQYLIGGVDHSQHGDVGVNGSRGSTKAFANVVFKCTKGHDHTAREARGALSVGKSTGRMEYENGLSTHTNTHVAQYQNGKRTHIDIFDGRWKA